MVNLKGLMAGVAMFAFVPSAMADEVTYTLDELDAKVDLATKLVVDQCVQDSGGDVQEAMSCLQLQMSSSRSAPTLVPSGSTLASVTNTAMYLLASVANSVAGRYPDDSTRPNFRVVAGTAPPQCAIYTNDIPAYQSCLYVGVMALVPASGNDDTALVPGVCYAYSDEPVAVVSVICEADAGVPIAMAGKNAAATPVVTALQRCLSSRGAAIHPGAGITNGGVEATVGICY